MKKPNKGLQKHFASKIGVGLDSYLDLAETVENTYSLEELTKLPPFNIKKTTPKDYVIELLVPGVEKENIKAVLGTDSLKVTATVKKTYDPEGDDVYLHKGIWHGGKIDIEFAVARNLEFKEANYVNGVLSIHFVDINPVRTETRLPIGPFENVGRHKVKYNAAGEPIVVLETDEEVVEKKSKAPAFVSSLVEIAKLNVNEVAEEEAVVEVNVGNETKPSFEIVLPTVLPEIVQVEVEKLVDEVDVTSEEVQFKVNVLPAVKEIVEDKTKLKVVKTPEGKKDVVVSVSEAVVEELEELEVDSVELIETVEKIIQDNTNLVEVEDVPLAVEHTDVVLDIEGVTVVAKETLPSIVELVYADGEIKLNDVVSDIDDKKELVAVVTAENNVDVIAVYDERMETYLEEKGFTVEELIEKVSEKVPTAEAFEDEKEVVEETLVEDVTEVILHAEDPEVPTVEVVLPNLLPEVVEVKVEQIVDEVDVTSEEPQFVVTVVEAEEETVAVVAETEEEVLTEPEVNFMVDDVEVASVVLETEETLVDVTVVAEAETVAEYKEEYSLDILEDVKEAYEKAEEVTAVTLDEDNELLIDEAWLNSEDEVVDEPLVEEVEVEDETEVIVNEVVEDDQEVFVVATLNDDNNKKLTVDVIVEKDVPQVMELEVVSVNETLDKRSDEPQVVLQLTDGTYEVEDADKIRETIVIHTEEGKADLVVVVSEETATEMKELKLDPEKVVKEALADLIDEEKLELDDVVVEEEAETTSVTVVEEVEDQPETYVEAYVPLELSLVMKAEVKDSDDLGTIIEIKAADENVPDDVQIVPVITPEGHADILIAVDESAKKVIEESGQELIAALEKAVADSKKLDEEDPDLLIEENPDLK